MSFISRLITATADLFGAQADAISAPADDVLAVAALLVHVARVDGRLDAIELQRLSRLLAGIGRAETDVQALIARAIAFDDETRDVATLVDIVGRDAPEEQRRRLLAMAWAVAAADGLVQESEDDLVWRVGHLLGFDDAAITAAREHAMGSRAATLEAAVGAALGAAPQ